MDPSRPDGLNKPPGLDSLLGSAPRAHGLKEFIKNSWHPEPQETVPECPQVLAQLQEPLALGDWMRDYCQCLGGFLRTP